MSSLQGTVALVTGASSGIGAATAQRLASLGANVALVARRRERLDDVARAIETAGGTAFTIEADVTDRAQASDAVERAVQRLGRLDILVNNAGVMFIGSAAGADIEEWTRMVEVNVLGQLHVAHAALPHLLAAAEQSPRRVADLINVGSVAGRQATPMNAVYGLTKAGIAAFTESLRQELAKRHVRVGLLEPGSVSTELASHNRPEILENVLGPYFQEIETLTPDDVADAIAFMVTRPRRAAVFDLWFSPTEQV